MRISDWSSDVCSSDLLLVGETWHELGELRGIGDALLCKLFATCGGNRHRHVNQPLRPLLRRHDDLVHNDTTGVGRSRSGILATRRRLRVESSWCGRQQKCRRQIQLQLMMEIGIASCRERVCKYV